jgi:hypothetical protein
MLRVCVLTYDRNWEHSLPYAEFSYNNNYQSSLGMSPFKALCKRKCRTTAIFIIVKNITRIFHHYFHRVVYLIIQFIVKIQNYIKGND